MNYSKLLLIAMLMAGFVSVGCTGKKRIEGTEVPTQPQTNDVTVPAQAPPMADTNMPDVPAAPTTEATEAPTEEAAAPPAPPPPPPPVKETKSVDTYLVVQGDTLWGIAGMEITYKDNFQWPLLFKANRDQIKDPDLIYPKQEFLLRRDWTQGDIDKARKDASDTPKYVPHTKPRETLPVDYF